jgi:cell wall-associated NlpC family hydrolase/SH3-like domain-containing protein
MQQNRNNFEKKLDDGKSRREKMSRRSIILGVLLAGSVATSGIVFDGTGKMNMQPETDETSVETAAEPTAEASAAERTEGVYASGISGDIGSLMQEAENEAQSMELAQETDLVEAVERQLSQTAETLAVAQVTNYVNVRAEPNTESDILGKLYHESVGTVLEQTEDGWYRIQSGSVEGYVKSEYVVVGDEELEKAVGTRYATVNTTTLFVRAEPTTEAAIITMLPEGDDLVVTDDATEGWVKVSTEEGDGYISTGYVILSHVYKYAESKEEEEIRLEKEAAAAREAAQAAEAARKAQAAAAQKAQTSAAAQKMQEETKQQGTSGGSGNGGVAASAVAGSTNSAGTASAGTGSTNSSGTASAATSNGQAVVDYAMQFLGNPYVYGGTSLTNGTDCSGFVMRVYEAFGVKLPRTSAEQRSAGYGVNLSEIKAGDIVCYSGHVGIYVGNNTIIHASTAETGIILTSPVTYRNVLAVRRIF